MDEVVLLTKIIEDFFEAKKKAGVVFVNLSAIYDTVWHRGLTCKLKKLEASWFCVKKIYCPSKLQYIFLIYIQ